MAWRIVVRLQSHGAAAREASEWPLLQLPAAGTTGRSTRPTRDQATSAKFPAHRGLLGFGSSQSRVGQRLAKQLANLEFMAAAQNTVLAGGGWCR